MDPDVRLDNPHCEDKMANKKLYQSMISALMYASIATRPDLSYCVTTLSRYNAAPLMMHITAAKRALRYLKTTKDLKLNFTQAGDHDTSLLGFTDSDWPGNKTNRKSVGGPQQKKMVPYRACGACPSLECPLRTERSSTKHGPISWRHAPHPACVCNDTLRTSVRNGSREILKKYLEVAIDTLSKYPERRREETSAEGFIF
jgi:hypothetical protein